MRVVVIALVALSIATLGVLQFLGSVAVRASAQRGALVGLVPARVARRVDALETDLPLPGALRIVLARHAIARGDLALAERDVARLGASRDRFVLEGSLAEARHDPAAAVIAYMAAGDFADVQAAVDGRANRGDIAGALALERAAIARLHDDRTQADVLAEAYFQLGLLEQTEAYGYGAGAPERQKSELAALGAYGRAVALAPLSLRYLVALGNQQLNVAETGVAERTFLHAHDIDPTSAEPLAGLADAALRRNDLASARAFLARARALDPASSAVRRLTDRLGG